MTQHDIHSMARKYARKAKSNFYDDVEGIVAIYMDAVTEFKEAQYQEHLKNQTIPEKLKDNF